MPIYHKGAFVAARIEEPVLRQSKAAVNRTWQAFLHGGTNHSARASTMLDIINRCEREGVPYILEASPGQGYFIRHAPHLKVHLDTFPVKEAKS